MDMMSGQEAETRPHTMITRMEIKAYLKKQKAIKTLRRNLSVETRRIT
jgi:hypothetical protein